MRLSPFHMEIARLIAEGLPNREIKKQIKISDSRLSVLKSNPLMQRKVDEYRKIHEDKYKKALDIFAQNAESVASNLVDLVKNTNTPAQVRGQIGEKILDRLSVTSNVDKKSPNEEELVFEQLLRVTKRTQIQDSEDSIDESTKSALEELESDLDFIDDESDLVDVTPVVSFTKQLPENTPMPTITDNGGSKHHGINEKLLALLRH